MWGKLTIKIETWQCVCVKIILAFLSECQKEQPRIHWHEACGSASLPDATFDKPLYKNLTVWMLQCVYYLINFSDKPRTDWKLEPYSLFIRQLGLVNKQKTASD